MSRVASIKGTDPLETTIKSLEMIDLDVQDLRNAKKPFLITLNYINSQHPSTGITTDAGVVEGIVKFLREHEVQEIIIGEGSGYAHAFPKIC